MLHSRYSRGGAAARSVAAPSRARLRTAPCLRPVPQRPTPAVATTKDLRLRTSTNNDHWLRSLWLPSCNHVTSAVADDHDGVAFLPSTTQPEDTPATWPSIPTPASHRVPAAAAVGKDGDYDNGDDDLVFPVFRPTPGHGATTARTPSPHVGSGATATGDSDGGYDDDDDDLLFPPSSPRPRGGSRCFLLAVGRSTLRTSRVVVSAQFAEDLAGGPVDLHTGAVVVPVHLAGCRPRTHVPDSCTVCVRQRDGRPVGRYVAGLGAFLRANGAAAECTLLLLTAVAPGPGPGADAAAPGTRPRASLQAELISEQDVGQAAFEAMHHRIAASGPWYGTPADYSAQFLHQQQQRRGNAALKTNPRTKAPSPPPSPPLPNIPAPPRHAGPLPPDALVMVRKVRKTVLTATRVNIPAAFAEELAGRPFSTPGDKVTVPIRPAGCEPQAFLPAACYIAVRGLAGGAVERILGGLSAYIRNNGAVADSTLLWLAAVPADPALGHDRPSLQVRLINGWDMEPAAFSALDSFIGRATAWTGRYKHYEPFLAAAVQRTQWQTQAGAAAGGPPDAAPQELRPRPLSAAAAAPVLRSPRMDRLPRAASPQVLEQRLGLLPEGLDMAHVDAIRAYLRAATLQIKAVELPQRALRHGAINVHQAFATACGATWQRGAKPDPVAVPLRHCYPPPATVPFRAVAMRGTPRSRRRSEGTIEWQATGLRRWLHEAGAAHGDLLLMWVEGAGQGAEEGVGSGGAGQVGLHLVRQAEVGPEVVKAIWPVVAGW